MSEKPDPLNSDPILNKNHPVIIGTKRSNISQLLFILLKTSIWISVESLWKPNVLIIQTYWITTGATKPNQESLTAWWYCPFTFVKGFLFWPEMNNQFLIVSKQLVVCSIVHSLLNPFRCWGNVFNTYWCTSFLLMLAELIAFVVWSQIILHSWFTYIVLFFFWENG